MRALGIGAVVAGLCGAAAAAPPAAPAPTSRYDGPRLALTVPAGTQVKETPDVVADYAVDLVMPPGAAPAQTTMRILLSNAKVLDLDVEPLATAWRDARVRNRASWGVHKKAGERAEVTHVASRRFVRLVDQMGSVLGATSQLMLCGSVSARMLCGVASGPAADAHAREALLVRILESATVKKRQPGP